MLSPEPHPSLFGEILQQSADDFPQAAEFVGQRLMGGPDRSGLGEERGRQSLIELLKSHRRDELQELRQTLRVAAEYVVAEFFDLVACLSG